MRPHDVELDADFMSAIPDGQNTPELDAAIKETPALPKNFDQKKFEDLCKAAVLFPV